MSQYDERDAIGFVISGVVAKNAIHARRAEAK